MMVEQETLRPAGRTPFPAEQATGDPHPLQQAAARLQEQREGRSRLRAKDLVGLLLSHGARAWRSSQPVARLRVKVSTPPGLRAVAMRLPQA